MIEEIGKLESTGGKRAVRLVAVADFKMAIGLDIAKSHISLVLVDLKGILIAYEKWFYFLNKTNSSIKK